MRFSGKKINENDGEYDNFLPKIGVHKSVNNHTMKKQQRHKFLCIIPYILESHNPQKKFSYGLHYLCLTPQFFEEFLHGNTKTGNL